MFEGGTALSYALVVEDLVKIYGGGVIGVNGVSFRVREGEIYALVGPNGSGKTTTLRIIATLIKPTRGRVLVYGVDAVREPLKVRQMINYLPEEAGVYRDLTGLDFIRFMLSTRFTGRKLEEAVAEALEIAGLREFIRKPVRTYSKGMKRLLALSVVLASKPKLLLLDEPTTGLDVDRSIQVRELIRKYNREYGVTVLLSSHNMLEVERLSHRVGVLYRGKLVAEGSPEELKAKYGASNLEEAFIKIKESTG